MADMNDQLVREMVERVLEQVKTGWGGRVPPTAGASAAAPLTAGFGSSYSGGGDGNRFGQFTNVNEAVEAAKEAQKQLMKRSMAQRDVAIDLIRQIVTNRADELGRMEYEETKLGHAAHKPGKLVVAGRVAQGTKGLRTECFSGDHGITLEEHAPWGVAGVVTPVTHSLPTMAVNAMDMIAAGNSMVCNPHPGGKRIAALGAKLFNQAIYEKLGIDNLICVITEPTLESANQIFKHPDVPLLVITGGPGVVAAALASGKRAVCAGPGNPPVVVDASADLENAARCIIEGASYDNNLLCLGEKEVFVVEAVWDKMLEAMAHAGACRLSRSQMDELARIVIEPPKHPGGHGAANRKFVGQEPHVIAAAIGVNVPQNCRLLYGETSFDSQLVQAEQMMPLLPFVKCHDFEQAVDFAVKAEHGFRHTAILHSRLVDHMTYMGKAVETTLFVKNGPSVAGNGSGGEGYSSYSIACATGEGVATPMTYTRLRRCAMVDNLRII